MSKPKSPSYPDSEHFRTSHWTAASLSARRGTSAEAEVVFTNDMGFHLYGMACARPCHRHEPLWPALLPRYIR